MSQRVSVHYFKWSLLHFQKSGIEKTKDKSNQVETKGQLISEGNFGVSNLPKSEPNFLNDFCSSI
jgi:hypothetical protein